MTKKIYLLIVSILIVVALIGLVLFLKNKQSTLTSYENADGWVYQCSQPIKAKNGTAQTLGHPQGLVPIDESEAVRYCHSVGIE